jgi:hypothetical protein
MAQGSISCKSRKLNSIYEMHPAQMLVLLSRLSMVIPLTAKLQPLKALRSTIFYSMAATSESRLLFHTEAILIYNL